MARRLATRANCRPPAKEVALHISVVAFLRRAWPEHLPFWHCPNGEQRDHRTRTTRDGRTVRYSPAGQKLQAMGLLAGAPDLTFVLPNGQAAFLELKAPGGQLSDAQIAFRDRVLALGCAYVVADNFDEVERILTRWLSKFGLRLRATGGVRAPPAPLFEGAAG